jgi:hypothetical protein
MATDLRPAAFMVLGLSFIAIGASRQRALVGIGVGFLVIAIVRMIRARRP